MDARETLTCGEVPRHLCDIFTGVWFPPGSCPWGAAFVQRCTPTSHPRVDRASFRSGWPRFAAPRTYRDRQFRTPVPTSAAPKDRSHTPINAPTKRP
jgi:hypothetical protein